MRLNRNIARLAADRLFAWHRDQAKREVSTLRKTMLRLVKAGVPESELKHILMGDLWQIELAKCMSEHLMGEP